MRPSSWLITAVFIVSFSLFLTSCPEDNNASLPGSQWILVSVNGDTVGYVEYIEFTNNEVNFYEDLESCWDFYSETYEIHEDSLIMSGGEYMVGFELDGDHLHILTEGGEWVYTKDSFDATEFNICQAVKRSRNWKALK